MKPCIICVAITGSLPRKENNPAVPISVSEQIESTHAAFEEGASILHAHVRNDDETPSSDPEKFAALKEGIEKHCPGMIIQFSTGGRSGAGQERGGMLPLAPDMASPTVGSNNFPTASMKTTRPWWHGWRQKCASIRSPLKLKSLICPIFSKQLSKWRQRAIFRNNPISNLLWG